MVVEAAGAVEAGPVAAVDLPVAAPVVGGSMKLINKIKKKINTQKIESAIAEFESHIDFEFIPVIANKSSYVEHISWVLSLIFLILFMGLIDYIFSVHLQDSYMSPLVCYTVAPFLAVLCGVLLDKSDWVDRFFITKPERTRQVQEKAERIFYKHQMHELKSQNALILYISVMERQIVLFHDPRIKFEKMQQIDEQILSILQQSFKSGDFEAGLLNAIAHLKTELLPHFPLKEPSKDQNFVPNKLIWWDE
ncbi:MAG: hypothetical protein AABY53_08970 [Bdellovibrionota bacterium]